MFKAEADLKVNYKVIYQILSHYSDAEFSADNEEAKNEKSLLPPKTKQELF
jgi:hypothetical protein